VSLARGEVGIEPTSRSGCMYAHIELSESGAQKLSTMTGAVCVYIVYAWKYEAGWGTCHALSVPHHPRKQPKNLGIAGVCSAQ
jgi:hypothetical protein